MPKRKKSTRRNKGGRGSAIPLGGPALPSAAELDQDMRVTQAAMDIAHRLAGRSNWITY